MASLRVSSSVVVSAELTTGSPSLAVPGWSSAIETVGLAVSTACTDCVAAMLKLPTASIAAPAARSEERRVGEEWGAGRSKEYVVRMNATNFHINRRATA